MHKIVYDQNIMKLISLFESLTQSTVKDCISGNPLIFVVEFGQISKAIGKNGIKVKKFEQMLKKKVRIIEFNSDVRIFVSNLIHPIKVEEIHQEDNKVIISDPSMKIKGKIIGRDSSNLKWINSIAKRYFDISDIIVK